MKQFTTIQGVGGSPCKAPDTTTPFRSAEEAWFWFIQAQTARNEGAKTLSGAGFVTRPCEPVDIITCLERLYRSRRVLMDHVMILRHYGYRMMPPDPRRAKEVRAHELWTEALDRLEDVLVTKRIVVRPHWIKLVSNNDA